MINFLYHSFIEAVGPVFVKGSDQKIDESSNVEFRLKITSIVKLTKSIRVNYDAIWYLTCTAHKDTKH